MSTAVGSEVTPAGAAALAVYRLKLDEGQDLGKNVEKIAALDRGYLCSLSFDDFPHYILIPYYNSLWTSAPAAIKAKIPKHWTANLNILRAGTLTRAAYAGFDDFRTDYALDYGICQKFLPSAVTTSENDYRTERGVTTSPGVEGVGEPCLVGSVAGTCKETKDCDGKATPGHCPGPASVQCCTSKGVSTGGGSSGKSSGGPVLPVVLGGGVVDPAWQNFAQTAEKPTPWGWYLLAAGVAAVAGALYYKGKGGKKGVRKPRRRGKYG